MKRRLCIGIVVGVPAIVALMSFWLTGATPSDPAAKKAEFKRQMRSLFGGRIELAGMLVDEKGNVLDDVEILVVRREGRERDTYKANRTFHLSYTNSGPIYVDFKKSGYYSGNRGGAYVINDQVPIGPNGVREIVETNMTVVLLEVGGPMMAGDYYDGLDFSWSRRCYMAQLNLNFDTVCTEQITNVAALPPDTIYLWADTTNGVIQTIAFTNWVHEPWTTQLCQKVVSGIPTHVSLRVTGETNGLRRFVPLGIYTNTSTGFVVEMRDAPEEGYTNVLDLAAGESYVPFFFHIRGSYGKGYVAKVSRSDERRIKAMVRLYPQRDRSRNVRTPQM